MRTSSASRAARRWLAGLGRLAIATAVAVPGGMASAETLKIATVSPDGSVWMRLLRDAGAAVERETEGRVKLKYYPGGVMGDERAMIRKMRVGQLQGAVVTTGVLARIHSDIQIYNLPMQFRSLAEVDYLRERLDPELLAGLEANGFVALGLAEVGMAYALSTEVVTAVATARRLKVWTPAGNDGAVKAMGDFGITPIPLSISDVLAGLQTGLIDTVAAPVVGVLALQWHSQLKYILDLPFMYVYAPMVLAQRPFARLAAADQATVRRLLGAAVRAADAGNRADHDAVWEVLQRQGLSLLRPTAVEAAEWQRLGDAAAREWVADGVVSRALYDRVVALLAEYRAQASG